MIKDLSILNRLAVIAAQAYIDYDEEHPDVGARFNDKVWALTQVEKEAKCVLDKETILKEWRDEEYQQERAKHPCGICKELMELKTNSKTGDKFWGCVNFNKKWHKEIQDKTKEIAYISYNDDNYWDAMEDWLSIDYDHGF